MVYWRMFCKKRCPKNGTMSSLPLPEERNRWMARMAGLSFFFPSMWIPVPRSSRMAPWIILHVARFLPWEKDRKSFIIIRHRRRRMGRMFWDRSFRDVMAEILRGCGARDLNSHRIIWFIPLNLPVRQRIKMIF